MTENNDEASDEEEVPEITHWEAIGWLAVLTLWISVLSGYLVDAIQVIEHVTKRSETKKRQDTKEKYISIVELGPLIKGLCFVFPF